MSSCLQIQTLKHFKIPSSIDVYAFRDNLFVFYSNANSKIQVYDINTFILTDLTNNLGKIKSKITSITISPSHSIIAFGFSDGHILLYAQQSQKVTKIKLKQKEISIVCICFISDSLLISSTSDSKITGYRLSANRFGITYKDFPIASLLETANILLAPPLYDYISENTPPRCISQAIEGIFIYKTKNNFAICKISDKFQVLIELSYQECIFDFSSIYNDEVNVGLAKSNTIEIYKITKEKKIELIYFYEINLKPLFITFFAPTIFLVNFEDVKCYVFSIEKVSDSTKENFLDSISEIHNENLPENGYKISDQNLFYLFGANGTYKISMITFYDILNRFRKEGQFDETVEFCKKAISGDYKASMGLPLNSVQKLVKIEEAMTPIINKKCEEDLENPENSPSEVANSMILLSIELDFKNWMTTYGFKIFQTKGVLKYYFREIIKLDPEAHFFFYNKDWVASLIENSEDVDANKFLLSLPKKSVPNQVLVEIAKKRNDLDLLVDILTYKMNDYVDAAAIIWNSGYNQKLCQMFDSFLYPLTNDIEISVSLISWLFGIKKDLNGIDKNNDKLKKEYTFPHLLSLLSFNDQMTINVLNKIKSFIKEYKRPFTLTEFVNALLHTIQNNPDLDIKNKVMDMIDELIFDFKIKIAKENLQIIFSRIFTNKKNTQQTKYDNREALLLIIVNENVSKEFNDLLLPLCDNFGFNFAKKCIYILNQEFERAFKEVIYNSEDNIFYFIKQTIRSHSAYKEQIGEAILSISPYLITNNVTEFYSILNIYYPELIQKAILSLNDEDDLRNYYIKYLLKFHDISKMNLPKNVLISFCQFLCKYYPEDTKNFIELEKDLLTDFYQICQEYKIYDACAIIAGYTNDMKSFISYLTLYFTLKMVDFVDCAEESDEKIEEFNQNFKFVLSKLENSITKKSSIPEIDELCKSVVECFVLPFYAIQCAQKEDILRTSKIQRETTSEIPAQMTRLQQKKINVKLPDINVKRHVSDMNSSNDDYSDSTYSGPPKSVAPMKHMKSERLKVISSDSLMKSAPVEDAPKANLKPDEKMTFLQIKAKILSADMAKICTTVSKVLSYPVLLAHLVDKFENIHIEFTRETFLSLLNDAAYDLQTTAALAQLFHQDERDIHDKFIMKQLKGIVLSENTMTKCGTCNGQLNQINCLVRIFPCGHAFHDNQKCLPKQICPICNPEVRIDQDVKRPTFAIHGNASQRYLKKFELKMNKKLIDEDIETPYIPSKGAIKIKKVPATIPEPSSD